VRAAVFIHGVFIWYSIALCWQRTV